MLTPGFVVVLDVLLIKKEDGGLGYQMYRKETHTDIYLHGNSHHLVAQKVGIINTLATREKGISDANHLKNEFDHLGMVFQRNH